MKEKGIFALSFRTLLLVGVLMAAMSRPSIALENSDFPPNKSRTVASTWGDYSPLQEAALKCVREQKQATSTCTEIQARVGESMSDAFILAVTVNRLGEKGRQFCSAEIDKMFDSGDIGAMNRFALMVINERVEFGAALYGTQLNTTRLPKLLLDSLSGKYPC